MPAPRACSCSGSDHACDRAHGSPRLPLVGVPGRSMSEDPMLGWSHENRSRGGHRVLAPGRRPVALRHGRHGAHEPRRKAVAGTPRVRMAGAIPAPWRSSHDPRERTPGSVDDAPSSLLASRRRLGTGSLGAGPRGAQGTPCVGVRQSVVSLQTIAAAGILTCEVCCGTDAPVDTLTLVVLRARPRGAARTSGATAHMAPFVLVLARGTARRPSGAASPLSPCTPTRPHARLMGAAPPRPARAAPSEKRGIRPSRVARQRRPQAPWIRSVPYAAAHAYVRRRRREVATLHRRWL
jgi:hypothetical protein